MTSLLKEDVKNIPGGGGCRPYSSIFGGVYMKLNQFGGGLFEFHSDLGGVCCFDRKQAGAELCQVQHSLSLELDSN